MGINPMSMYGGFGGEDFYTQQLMSQMAQMNTAKQDNTYVANPYADYAKYMQQMAQANGQQQIQQTPQVQQAGSKGLGLGTTALVGTAVGGGTFAGMNWLNHSYNSPIEEVKGAKVFTNDFLKHFSSEYSLAKNEKAYADFFKNIGPKTGNHVVTPENYNTLMTELKEYISAEKPADFELSEQAKAVLKKQGIKADGSEMAKVRDLYAKNVYDLDNLRAKDNMTFHTERLSTLESLEEELKTVKKGDKATKLDFLRKNATHLGLKQDDFAKLLQDEKAITKTELDNLLKNVDIKAQKTATETSVKSIETEMKALAQKWDPKAGFWGKGKFKGVGNKKVASALDEALASMRKSKGGKYGLIAGGVAAAGTLALNLLA